MKQLYLQSFKLKATSNNRNMKDVKDILDEAQEKMDMAVMYLEESLAHIRAGKADVRLLDGIRVDSYGITIDIYEYNDKIIYVKK